MNPTPADLPSAMERSGFVRVRAPEHRMPARGPRIPRDASARRRGRRHRAATCIFAAAALTSAPLTAQTILGVDVGTAAGTIRNLGDMNCGPKQRMPRFNKTLDLTAWYRRLRVENVRTHDYYGPFDLPVVYPDETKDPKLSTSYNFSTSDPIAKEIVAAGGRLFLRLGTSWNKPALPKNAANVAEACLRILMHYRSGWAGGFKFDVREVEFWNEPNGRFWRQQGGSALAFYKLYADVARKIKAYDPRVKVGASGVAGNQQGTYRESFVAWCVQNKVPLDFYSWHLYTWRVKDPFAFAREALANPAWMKTAGAPNLVQMLTEWNLDLAQNRHPMFATVQGAAYMSAAMIYLQDTGVARAFLYRGDAFPYMGLFSTAGAPKPRAAARWLWARLLDTPVRLKTSGGDQRGFTLLAGRDANGTRVQVLVANYAKPIAGLVTLQLRNLPAGRWRADVFEVTAAGDAAWRASFFVQSSGSAAISWPGTGSWVRLVRLERAPASGPQLAAEDSLAPTEDLSLRYRLEAGSAAAGAAYFVLFSLSGTSPGFTLPGGVHVPLNADAVTALLLSLAGGPAAPGLAGRLDARGSGMGALRLGAVPPAAKGATLHAAAVLFAGGRLTAATPPVAVSLR